MRATFKLLNSYFWKTIYGPIIAFVLPVLLLAILGNIMRIQYVYPGIIAMSLMFIGILALPLSIMELKASSLFKYIGASPVDNKRFSIVAIGYYVFIAVISAFIIMFATMAIFPKEVFPKVGFKHGILGGIFNTAIGATSFYIATGIHLFMVIAFGLAIATFSKTPQQALTLAIVIVLPSMFLSGMILSVDIIAQSTVMQWISRFIFFRYTTGNIVVSSTSIDQLGDVFTLLSKGEKEVIFGKTVADGQNGLQADGSIYWHFPANGAFPSSDLNGTEWRFKTSDDIFEYINKFARDFDGNVVIDIPHIPFIAKDQELLFKLVIFRDLADGSLELLPASDNNIFDWVQPWGVRRIPEVEQIKNFIQAYFAGENGSGGNGGRFADIWLLIQKGDYTWLNLFLKQTNVLYTVPDRILNVVLPIALSIGSLYYVSKKFQWSSR